jgi:hypothetical protein
MADSVDTNVVRSRESNTPPSSPLASHDVRLWRPRRRTAASSPHRGIDAEEIVGVVLDPIG